LVEREMPTYANCGGWVISTIAGWFEVTADTYEIELAALRNPVFERLWTASGIFTAAHFNICIENWSRKAENLVGPFQLLMSRYFFTQASTLVTSAKFLLDMAILAGAENGEG
jgi:hypothetical protein